jgi:hypothetical protein
MSTHHASSASTVRDESMAGDMRLSDDGVLEKLQRETFDYFLHETNPANGLVIDKTAPAWPASIAATGLALACYPVSVERGFMTRAAAVERTLATLRFFWNSPQGTEADATGYQGFYYHFLDMQTGRRAWQCELSTVDSTFLLAGALAAAMYFDADSADESEIRTLGDALYRRANWAWAQDGGATVTHGWKPESGFLPYRWEGYDEALLLYILGLGSPTHPLPEQSYAAWATTYRWEQGGDAGGGQDYLYAGPLFTHQLSHVWIDFRGIQDDFMRGKGIDYFENSRRATYAQWRYAVDNPRKFDSYGSHCWGITASEGPGPATLKVNGIERQFFERARRWHARTVGGCGFAALRTRDRVADLGLLRLPGQVDRIQCLRLQGGLQSFAPGSARQSVWLVGLTLAFRPEPGADRSDDREPSVRLVVAVDAKLPVHLKRFAASGFYRRLASTLKPRADWCLTQPFSTGHFFAGDDHDSSKCFTGKRVFNATRAEQSAGCNSFPGSAGDAAQTGGVRPRHLHAAPTRRAHGRVPAAARQRHAGRIGLQGVIPVQRKDR